MSPFNKSCTPVAVGTTGDAANLTSRLVCKPLRMLALYLCCLLLCGLPLLVGCGGGSGHSGTGNTARGGKLSITIVWPQSRAGGKTRTIPDGTMSIFVELRLQSDPTSTPVASKLIPRGSGPQTTDTLDNLPLGKLYGSAKAYDNQTGNGNLLATAGFQIIIQANQTTQSPPIDLNSVVDAISIQPPPINVLIPGQTLTLIPSATSKGNPVVVAPTSWQWASDNSNVISVDSNGVIVAHQMGGPVNITVTLKDAPTLPAGSAKLSVNQGFISHITIDQASPLILAQGAQSPPLTATVIDNTNAKIQISGLTWHSDNPTVASVDVNTGVVTANSLGSANITVSAPDGHVSAGLQVLVKAGGLTSLVITANSTNSFPLTAGQQVTLTAKGKDQAGNPVDLAASSLTWMSQNPDIADGVKNADGSFVVTAKLAGTAHISVQDSSLKTTQPFTFDVPVRVNVAITPLTTPIPLGGTATFLASVTGTTDQRVKWTVKDGHGSITPDGGVYTAPTSPRVTATYMVVATSVADPAQSDASTIQVAVGTGTISVN